MNCFFQLTDLVGQVLSEDKICITIGGDHAIGMGTVQGFTQHFQQQNSCLLWIDAHADLNTMANSKSGNMHGMPVSFNIEQLFKQNMANGISDLDWFKPTLDPSRMAFIGLRCVDPMERSFIDHLKIPYFSMREIDEFGIREVRFLSNIIQIKNCMPNPA
jgi:arginase